MNPLFKNPINSSLLLATLSLASWTAGAVNPVPGLYAGMILGPNYAPSVDIIYPYPQTNISTHGEAHFSVFGNIAIQAGYRCNHLRGEAEIFYNNNPISVMQLGTTTFNSVSRFSTSEGVKAQTNTGAFMINGFYDLYTPGQTVYFSPYVGLGIGYANVSTTSKFYNNSVYIPGTSVTKSGSTAAAQVILGLGYFLDDFTMAGVDFRYFSTKGPVGAIDSRIQIATINLTVNGSFDRS